MQRFHLGSCGDLLVHAMTPAEHINDAVRARLARRAELLDELRKVLEELRAEEAAPCCHRGCAGCAARKGEAQR